MSEFVINNPLERLPYPHPAIGNFFMMIMMGRVKITGFNCHFPTYMIQVIS